MTADIEGESDVLVLERGSEVDPGVDLLGEHQALAADELDGDTTGEDAPEINEPSAVESPASDLPSTDGPTQGAASGGAPFLTLKTDRYRSLLPPLPPAALKHFDASIRANDVISRPVYYDENFNALTHIDWYLHCQKHSFNPDFRLKQGLSEKEKIEFILSVYFIINWKYDPKVERELREKRLLNLLDLRQEDPRRWTYAFIGACLGREESWVRKKEQACIRKNPDRVKVDNRKGRDKALLAEVVKRALNGEHPKKLAEETGIKERRIRLEKNKAATKAAPPVTPMEVAGGPTGTQPITGSVVPPESSSSNRISDAVDRANQVCDEIKASLAPEEFWSFLISIHQRIGTRLAALSAADSGHTPGAPPASTEGTLSANERESSA